METRKKGDRNITSSLTVAHIDLMAVWKRIVREICGDNRNMSKECACVSICECAYVSMCVWA